ncbi:MAG: hypothetical protein A2857_04040 [Candidatus Levybacteria bacterium RIFCSPHIGHO2_01_FULL_36_15]|nr:MAG: hypothetical protein A2857_04040 [Candidatus Levybacteria bacterium RIFCSPHIGHO2_01_FULL_36_15]OGH37446.1 MAG: hypothetical protein A2905_04915 [Candidatus Levybacteria bacterium RIFCSPLOWO2_01_FULL_36_10]
MVVVEKDRAATVPHLQKPVVTLIGPDQNFHSVSGKEARNIRGEMDEPIAECHTSFEVKKRTLVTLVKDMGGDPHNSKHMAHARRAIVFGFLSFEMYAAGGYAPILLTNWGETYESVEEGRVDAYSQITRKKQNANGAVYEVSSTYSQPMDSKGHKILAEAGGLVLCDNRTYVPPPSDGNGKDKAPKKEEVPPYQFKGDPITSTRSYAPTTLTAVEFARIVSGDINGPHDPKNRDNNGEPFWKDTRLGLAYNLTDETILHAACTDAAMTFQGMDALKEEGKVSDEAELIGLYNGEYKRPVVNDETVLKAQVVEIDKDVTTDASGKLLKLAEIFSLDPRLKDEKVKLYELRGIDREGKRVITSVMAINNKKVA